MTEVCLVIFMEQCCSRLWVCVHYRFQLCFGPPWMPIEWLCLWQYSMKLFHRQLKTHTRSKKHKDMTEGCLLVMTEGPQVSWLAFVFLDDKRKLESLSTAREEPWYRNWGTIMLIQFFLSLSLVTWWWYKLMKKSVSICLISRENSSELLTESMERIAFSLKNRIVCWSQWGPKPHEFT